MIARLYILYLNTTRNRFLKKDPTGIWFEQWRMQAFFKVTMQIAHLAGEAGGKPGPYMGRLLGQIHIGDTDLGETQVAGPIRDFYRIWKH